MEISENRWRTALSEVEKKKEELEENIQKLIMDQKSWERQNNELVQQIRELEEEKVLAEELRGWERKVREEE